MGEIILFRPREGQARTARPSVAEAGARILFFTGVRYERMADCKGDSGAPRSDGIGGARGGRRRRRG